MQWKQTPIFFLQQNTSQSIPGIASDFECCTFSIFILETGCIVCIYNVHSLTLLFYEKWFNEWFNNFFWQEMETKRDWKQSFLHPKMIQWFSSRATLTTCLLNAFLNVIVGHVVLCDVASQRADDDHSDDAREEEHNHNGVDDGEPVDLGVLQVHKYSLVHLHR